MADVKQLAETAAKVARFAHLVAVASRPATSPTRLLRTWLLQAVLLRKWPAIRLLLRQPSATSDADLANEARQAAAHCRGRCAPTQQAGMIKRAFRLIRGATVSPDGLFADLADLLERLADRLASDLAAGLDAILDEWRKPESAPGRIAALQTELTACNPTLGKLLHRLVKASTTIKHVEPIAGQLGSTAIALVRLVIVELAERTGDADTWTAFGRWAGEWLQAFDLDGQVILGPDLPNPVAGTEQEVFPCRAIPGKSAVFRLNVEPVEPVADRSAWAELPPCPDWPGVNAPPLTDWEQHAAPARFAKWVISEAGQEWFARCLAEAERDPRGSAAAWWRMLRTKGWCKAFPDLDLDANPPVPRWPIDLPLRWPAVSSAGADVPIGEIVQVRRYAPTASSARVVISDGRPSPESLLARFHELYASVGPLAEWWSDGRWEEARALSLEPPGDLERPVALLGPWLDLQSDKGGSSDNSWFPALRAWAERFGLTLTGADVVGGEAQPGIVTQAVFSDLPRGVVVRAKGYGLTAGEQVFRQALVERSLGPPPPGFAELEVAAERLPEKNPVRGRVALLREAFRGDYLREAAVELHVEYWGELGASLRASEPGLARDFAERLIQFLHSAYGLSVFTPTSIHDHPDGWLEVVPGGRAMTGMVRRVHRPGLQDEHGNLRIPALVEVG